MPLPEEPSRAKECPFASRQVDVARDARLAEILGDLRELPCGHLPRAFLAVATIPVSKVERDPCNTIIAAA